VRWSSEHGEAGRNSEGSEHGHDCSFHLDSFEFVDGCHHTTIMEVTTASQLGAAFLLRRFFSLVMTLAAEWFFFLMSAAK